MKKQKAEMERGRRVPIVTRLLDEDFRMLQEVREMLNKRQGPEMDQKSTSETVRAAIRIAHAQLKP